MILSKLSQTLRVVQNLRTIPVAQLRTTPHHSVPLPALLVLLAKPLAAASAALLGRSFRLAWARTSAESKMAFKSKWTGRFWLTGVVMSGCAWYGYTSHVQVCPHTGRRKFMALSEEQVLRISEDSLESILEEIEKTIVPNDHPDYKRVAKIANSILDANKDVPEIFGKNWTVYLVSEAEENAFVLPNGHIFVFGGMWTRCSDSDGKLNEDKLAIILGHEMAHAILGHTAEKLSLTNLIEACMLVPMAVIWAFIPSDGIAFITHWFIKKAMDIFVDLPFSREMEMEADTFGLKLAAKACYDIREAPAFWMVMELLEESGSILINCTKDDEDAKISEDFKTIDAYISTHPGHDDRYKQLQAIMESTLAIRAECGCTELDEEKDPCMRANQERKWWNENMENLIKQEIKAKQNRQSKNKGIVLHLPHLTEETNTEEINTEEPVITESASLSFLKRWGKSILFSACRVHKTLGSWGP